MAMPKFTNLETKRLILRQLGNADAQQLMLLRSDKDVNRYLERPASTNMEEAKQFIRKIIAGHATVGYYWVIALKEDNKLIGTICYWNIDNKNSIIEIGYELLPAFQGMGIMQEAISAVIDYNFRVLKFKKILACPVAAHARSINLLEKNNFIIDKSLEDYYYDNGGSAKQVIYSLTLS